MRASAPPSNPEIGTLSALPAHIAASPVFKARLIRCAAVQFAWIRSWTPRGVRSRSSLTRSERSATIPIALCGVQQAARTAWNLCVFSDLRLARCCSAWTRIWRPSRPLWPAPSRRCEVRSCSVAHSRLLSVTCTCVLADSKDQVGSTQAQVRLGRLARVQPRSHVVVLLLAD